MKAGYCGKTKDIIGKIERWDRMGKHTAGMKSDNSFPWEIIIQMPLSEQKVKACISENFTLAKESNLPGPKDFKQCLAKRERELKEHIRSNIHRLAPLDVMVAAMGYMRFVCMRKSMDKSSGKEQDFLNELHDNNALLVPEYLQSALVVLDQAQPVEDITDESKLNILDELFDDCEELIEMGRPLKMIRAAEAVGGNNRESFIRQFQLESKLYEDLRGKRYQILEEPYLRYLVGGQNTLIREIYGIDGSEIVDGVIALMDSLIKGWQTTINELSNFMDEFETLNRDDQKTMDRFQKRVSESDLSNRLLGPGLFDVKAVTGWPFTLIDDLTLETFSGSEVAGVDFEDLDPVEALPIKMRPFIRIDGTSYCFCYANFLDNFYRALYDAARRRYKLQHPLNISTFLEQWNRSQAKASENAVADLFSKLLPDSVIIQNSYHPLDGTAFSKKRYEESDLVVRFEDVLLSVEVKAGSYCPTDPIDDPEGHVKSLKALVEKAAEQAQATIDYVTRCSGNVCRLYDKDGNIMYEFYADDIKLFFKVCVTVDDINEFASKVEKTGMVDVPAGTIAVSIDDLLVYEKYFDNPLVFLHYLLERKRVTSNPSVWLNDELDHLGYYIWTNCYSEHISRLVKENTVDEQSRIVIVPEGLRNALNDWFESLYTGKNCSKPVPKSPAMFNKIVTALFERCDCPWRRLMACSLLDLGSNARERIEKSIRARVCGIKTVPANSMIEIPASSSDGATISLFVASPFSDCDWVICREKAISGILTKNDEERIVMLCTWSSPNQIDDCKIELLKKDEITESERVASSRYDFGIRTMRKNAAVTFAGRKVGRNELCPCGSGKKFKRCCGR